MCSIPYCVLCVPMAIKLCFYQMKLIIELASDSVLFLGETSCGASSEAVTVAAVPTHILYTGL